MAPSWSLKAVEGLAEALPQPAGLLLGAVDEAAHIVTLAGVVPAAADASGKAVADLAAEVLELLPLGVQVVGSYGCSAPPPLPPLGASGRGCPAVGVQRGGAGFTLDGEPAAAEVVAPAQAGALALAGFVVLRVHCDLVLRVVCPAGGATPQGLAHAFVEAAEQLVGPQLVFISEPKPGGAPALLTAASQGALQAALPAASLRAADPCASLAPLTATGSARGAPAAPALEFSPAAAGSSVREVLLGLDALVLVPDGVSPAGALCSSALGPALRRQLDLMEKLLARRLQPAPAGGDGGGDGLVTVRAHHFRPPGWALPVTACYPRVAADAGAAEDALLPRRQALHALLGLPADVPMLRFANALKWGAGAEGGDGEGTGRAARLRDVHLRVAPPSIGGSPSLIRGSYEYYHYMQARPRAAAQQRDAARWGSLTLSLTRDRFNDSGWGCAYRSLQTIVSWFRQQRYTDKPVPSHREIQQLLVKLGDKDGSFIGSSNWIGAIELSYILNEYLGITCKIMTVNRGADIPSHARELAAHFAAQGTPVMIGGGVLAYTLLGVQFDELTGEAAFLILDPHYTGGEDLKKIQQGTWVAWKVPGDSAAAGGPLFVDDTFYNFLLPQRPSTV